MKTPRVHHLIITTLLTIASGAAPSLASAQTSAEQAQADSILTWLNAGKFAHVSSVLNYPPSYSSQERADDEASVAGGLKLIYGNLGRFTQSKPFTGVRLSYEVSAAGGTIEYWAGLSPMKTFDHAYNGVFEHFGKGFIVVRFARIQSKWQATTIVFQLDSRVPGSRSRAIDIISELVSQDAKSKGQSLPPNLREQVSASIPDYSTKKQ